jgi:hypothetical protein
MGVGGFGSGLYSRSFVGSGKNLFVELTRLDDKLDIGRVDNKICIILPLSY